MPTPKDTLWDLDPHTLGKHKVLRSYLDAWFPILSRYNQRILFIDGFSGPGEYKNGEKGSPQIAFDALLGHSQIENIKSEVVFFFIEKRKDRAQHLANTIDKIRATLPKRIKVDVVNGSFDETMTKVLNQIEEHNKKLAPAFVMIDPFGVSDTPMKVISKLFKNPKSEVYISFMYEFINRFKEHEKFEQHLDCLFGCREWRKAINIPTAIEKKNFLFDLYKNQLKIAGAKYVVHFELYEENRLVYAIFFATQDLKGSDKMKQAIWKVDPFGGFSFRGAAMPELELTANPNTDPLKKILLTQFKSSNWVSIDQILKFVMSDKTDYHSNHVRLKTLKPMEKDGLIVVDETTRRRNGYPDGTMIKFIGKL